MVIEEVKKKESERCMQYRLKELGTLGTGTQLFKHRQCNTSLCRLNNGPYVTVCILSSYIFYSLCTLCTLSPVWVRANVYFFPNNAVKKAMDASGN